MSAREPDPVTDPLCDADPLARALAKLRPVQTGLDAQRLLFLAGQAERERSASFWRRVSVAQLAALVALGGAYLFTTLNDSEPVRHGHVGEPSPGNQQPPAMTGGPEVAPPPRPVLQPAPDRYYGIPQGFARAEPDDLSPEDRARWLSLRNDVLTAGLGLLPNPRPSWDRPFAPDPKFYAIPWPIELKTPRRDPDPPED